MTSWRDTASNQVRDDFAGMLHPVTEFAQHALSKFGELSPFGAAVAADGQIIMVAADPDSTDGMRDDQVADTLYEGAISRAGHLRAVAFVYDVPHPGEGAIAFGELIE